MVRPRLCRRVGFDPTVVYFKPRGVPMADLEETVLNVDELEALRLKDMDGLEQEECAKKMGISQPTFHRLITSARKKTAESIVQGHALRIEGGNVKLVEGKRRGLYCTGGMRT